MESTKLTIKDMQQFFNDKGISPDLQAMDSIPRAGECFKT